jgi:hypothetical protein
MPVFAVCKAQGSIFERLGVPEYGKFGQGF